ncbi:hypothetical protein B0T14DRAFT_496138 [Immersiella caudata]|uniref:CFEM domain-containing protein n=1 Tax=Immersiella caudata TaxID=314043 RepID=A0AA40BZP1_9PEZI|nr:hypothetical protein B0T14DRAFT_496138 [Immersiella caudata]
MKFTPAVLVAFAGLTAAQGLSSIPQCAQECISTAISSSTTCQATDIPCICNSIEAVTAGATSCVLAACGADVAIGQVLPATAQLCADALPNGPSSAAPAGTTTNLPGSTRSGVPTLNSPATPSGTASGDDDASSTVTTPASTGAAQTGTSTSTTSTSTAGAASFGAVGSLGMLLMGAVAAL